MPRQESNRKKKGGAASTQIMTKSCIISHGTCTKCKRQELGFLTVDNHRQPWGSVVNHNDGHCEMHVRRSIGTASPYMTQSLLVIDDVN